MGLGRRTYFSRLRHMFERAADLKQGRGYCHYHKKHCHTNLLNIDRFVSGLPCGPHSTQRSDRGTRPAQSCSEFNVLFEYVDCVERFTPKGGIIEEVPGLEKPLRAEQFTSTSRVPTMPVSWLHWLVAALKALGFGVRVLRLQNAIWITLPRKRRSSRSKSTLNSQLECLTCQGCRMGLC